MIKSLKFALSAVLLLTCSQAYSLYALPGHFIFEAGAYTSQIGKSQNVNINGLIGDSYNASNSYNGSSVFGVGYLVEGIKRCKFGLDYGINAFYLAKTKSSGTITQEHLFTNLAYSYYVSHLPIYATAKAYMNTDYEKVSAITVDAGVGPNFMDTSGFSDWSIDGGKTVPDNAFSGPNHRTVNFSAMAGLGLRLNVMRQMPIEVGYRFFYLGEGRLNPRSNQILNTLKTGNITAQALVLTVGV